ncbi:pyruvate, water dikinase regulatory protein [Marinicrinis lubricantis]|uniref:Putative pyruvate, phosphate dikinase regulatory protein n=1 Tax=Marinicrinis lubricantis TaxID=2086470 RepID=A0ABW1IUN8_9BACL
MTDMKKKCLKVYVISDSAGETGESVVRAAAAQFHPVQLEITRFPFVESKTAVDRVVQLAKDTDAVIAFTLVIPELKNYLLRRAYEYGMSCIDVLGPAVDMFEQRLDQESKHVPGIIHRLDEQYFKKIEAVEFAVKYDDCRDPKGILKADIVLVGVSRTSKTPLSMYLANKTFKVANVPLVPEISPPEELFMAKRHKIIGLKISSKKLNAIRKERLRSLGLGQDAAYAQVDRIERELVYAKELMERLGCIVIDVSDKAVEETASIIQEWHYRNH